MKYLNEVTSLGITYKTHSKSLAWNNDLALSWQSFSKVIDRKRAHFIQDSRIELHNIDLFGTTG